MTSLSMAALLKRVSFQAPPPRNWVEICKSAVGRLPQNTEQNGAFIQTLSQ